MYSKKSFYSIIIFVWILIIQIQGVQYQCQHDIILDDVKQKLDQIPIRNPKRKLEDDEQFILGVRAEPAPIRITFDVSRLNGFDHVKESISNIMDLSRKYISDVFYVLPIEGDLIIYDDIDDENTGIMSNCQIWQDYITITEREISSSDLHIYIINQESEENWVARATSCQSLHGRSTVGLIIFNTTYYTNNFDNSDRMFEQYIEIALHEMFHVLGFSEQSYQYFRSENGKKYTDTNYIIGRFEAFLLVTPEIQKATREHFGCESSAGMYFENDGNSGSVSSHWELRYLFNEIMNPLVTQSDSMITNFTIALFKDSHWYALVDQEYSESFQWGKDKGCDFFKSCEYKEFDKRSDQCSFFHFGKAESQLNNYIRGL